MCVADHLGDPLGDRRAERGELRHSAALGIFARVIEIVPTPTFLQALSITGKTFLIGNVIAIVVGVPLGVAMGRSELADRILLPWVNMFLSAPLSRWCR